MATKRRAKPKLTVLAAVEGDLKLLAKRDPALAKSALAASALALARLLDDGSNSATSRAMCARALTETLDRLFERAPDEQEADKLDDLSARRAARLAGGSKTAG